MRGVTNPPAPRFIYTAFRMFGGPDRYLYTLRTVERDDIRAIEYVFAQLSHDWGLAGLVASSHVRTRTIQIRTACGRTWGRIEVREREAISGLPHLSRY